MSSLASRVPSALAAHVPMIVHIEVVVVFDEDTTITDPQLTRLTLLAYYAIIQSTDKPPTPYAHADKGKAPQVPIGFEEEHQATEELEIYLDLNIFSDKSRL